MSTKEYRKTKDLKLWEQNPRSIRKEDFERLKKQIQELGQYKPLIITKDGEVIGGNMRLRAYRELGIEDVWVSVVDPKDDMEKLKYALSDNDRAGYYDDDLLANLSSAFPDFEWSDYAVDLTPPETLDKVLFKEEVQEDEVPEVSDKEPISKLGEVYQLGRHKLMCGDSTKVEDVEKLMNGQKADMVFTDPPYNVGLEYQGYKDNKNDLEYETFCSDYLTNCLMFSPFVVVTPGKSNESIYYRNHKVIDSAVWFKKFGLTHGSVYKAMVTEPILFFGTKPTSRFLDTDHLEFITDRESGVTGTHSCPKPVGLSAKLIETFSDNSVLDLFGGSGSTLIACEQLNRTCYMMEIDPKYCDVIRKRYAKFVGKENEWEKVSPKVQ